MKVKKTFVAMVVVFSMMAVFTVGAHAAWYTCTVDRAGIGWANHVYITLSDVDNTPAFTKTLFTAFDGRKDEMLATALMAMVLSKKVLVKLSGTTEGSLIVAMYLVNE